MAFIIVEESRIEIQVKDILAIHHFINRLSTPQLAEVCTHYNRCGINIIQLAAKLHWTTALALLLGRLPSENQKDLILSRNRLGINAIHTAVMNGELATLKLLLNPFTDLERTELMSTNDGCGWNTMQCSVIYRRKTMLNFLLELLHNDKQVDAIMLKSGRRNLVYYAGSAGDEEMMEILLSKLDIPQQAEAILTQDKDGRTVLQTIALQKNRGLLKLVYNKLTKSQQVRAITDKNDHGFSVVDISLDDPGLTVDLLSEHDQKSTGEILLNVTVSPKYEDLISAAVISKHDDILTNLVACFYMEINMSSQHLSCLSLSLKQIEILNPVAERYILTSPLIHAVVCYNTSNRDGATEEAEYLHNSFVRASIDSQLFEWSNIEELKIILSQKKESTLVFISLLSHGFRGYIQGCDNSCEEITNIIHHLDDHIPSHTPLVCVLWAPKHFILKSLIDCEDCTTHHTTTFPRFKNRFANSIFSGPFSVFPL